MPKENHLVFTPLFTADPHVFISSTHPLSGNEFITLEELENYPCLAFEQGEYNSFYFSENYSAAKNTTRKRWCFDM